MTRSTLRHLTLLTFSLAAAPVLVAQESTGAITGQVQTKAGQPLADAQVRLTSPQLQGVRATRTDDKGSFRAPLLPPGTYQIVVTKPGFMIQTVSLTLGLGQVVHQPIYAAASEAGTTVEILGEGTSVDKSDVKSQTNISSEMMDLLPRHTRTMDAVALLSPGVTTGMGDRIQMRGGLTHQNRFLLNGTDIADNLTGQATGEEYYVDDNIQEIQIIQSPVHARYGNFSGGVINAITKSGGNEFTGTIRGTFYRTAWSAQAPRGTQPSIGPTNSGTLSSEDEMTRRWTVAIGGPIIKDKLWFSLSTKQDPSIMTPRSFADLRGILMGDGSGAQPLGYNGVTTVNGVTFMAGNAYFSKADTKFYEAKFTYSITPLHTLELAGNSNKKDDANRPPSSTFDPRTLETYSTRNDYLTLAYRGIIGNSLTLEGRAAKKHNQIVRGGDPANGNPVRVYYANGGLYLFNNAMYDKVNGAENRDITSYIANLQWFGPTTALGTHQVDVGFEFLKHSRRAPSSQAATNVQLIVWGINPDGTFRVAPPTTATAKVRNRIYLMDADQGTATSDFSSYYVNDIWAITQNFQVLGGLRYDKVASFDTFNSPNVSSNQLSPRFQLTWDPKGDQTLVLRANAARYVGKLNDSYTNKFTKAGTALIEIYNWKTSVGPMNNATLADISNLSNWDISPTGFYGAATTANREGDHHTKAPYMDELGFEVKKAWKSGSFLSLAYAQRKGGNFFNDYFYLGSETTIPLKFAQSSVNSAIEHWSTDTVMNRHYKSVELQFLAKLNASWSFGGNHTYSILKGNTEATETAADPVYLDPIGNLDSVHQKYGRTLDDYSPYGYLAGDTRNRGNLYLSYAGIGKGGSSFYGSLLFNYRGGSSYSLTRTVKFEVADEIAAAPAGTYKAAYSEFATYDRYYGPRGIGRFNDYYNFDLKLGWQIPIAKRLSLFAEATVYNVFNHWQQRSYSTSSNTGSTLYTSSPLAGYSATARRVLANGDVNGFGTSTYANFVGGRYVWLSTGLKW